MRVLGPPRRGVPQLRIALGAAKRWDKPDDGLVEHPEFGGLSFRHALLLDGAYVRTGDEVELDDQLAHFVFATKEDHPDAVVGLRESRKAFSDCAARVFRNATDTLIGRVMFPALTRSATAVELH